MSEENREAMRMRQLADNLCPECKSIYDDLCKLWASDDIEKRRLADNEILRRQNEREEDLLRKDD